MELDESRRPLDGARVDAALAASGWSGPRPILREALGSPAQEAADLLDWRANIAALGRVVNVTPGTPPDRVAFLRKTISGILQDPDFAAEMKRSQMTVSFANAEEVTTMFAKSMTALDTDRLAAVRDIIINRYY